MAKTLLNKDGEEWCPTCGTVLEGPVKGATYPRPGTSKHGASCLDVGLDNFGNIRPQKFLDVAPDADEVA